MTPNQNTAICYHLWKRPDSIPEEEWITIDQWNLAKDLIDSKKASRIIGLFKEGSYQKAIHEIINHACVLI